jgi:hypothetical protein
MLKEAKSSVGKVHANTHFHLLTFPTTTASSATQATATPPSVALPTPFESKFNHMFDFIYSFDVFPHVVGVNIVSF